MAKEAPPVVRPKGHILPVMCRVRPDSLMAAGAPAISQPSPGWAGRYLTKVSSPPVQTGDGLVLGWAIADHPFSQLGHARTRFGPHP